MEGYDDGCFESKFWGNLSPAVGDIGRYMAVDSGLVESSTRPGFAPSRPVQP